MAVVMKIARVITCRFHHEDHLHGDVHVGYNFRTVEEVEEVEEMQDDQEIDFQVQIEQQLEHNYYLNNNMNNTLLKQPQQHTKVAMRSRRRRRPLSIEEECSQQTLAHTLVIIMLSCFC